MQSYLELGLAPERADPVYYLAPSAWLTVVGRVVSVNGNLVELELGPQRYVTAGMDNVYPVQDLPERP